MAFIYAADLWCDACGERLRAELTAEGHAPTDPDDHYSYDSGEFPKDVESPGASDAPDHCASGSECVNAIDLREYGAQEDALKGAESILIGELIGGKLTDDGVEYLREMLADDDNLTPYQTALHAYWRAAFSDYL